MKKLIMWNVVTLDGCFEGEKPWELSFHELVWGPDLEALSKDQLGEASAIVFGKRTYEGMAKHWTNAETAESAEDQSITSSMNSIAKIVCSSTLEKAEWNNTTIVRDTIADMQRLKAEDGGPMYVFGSGTLSESLMNAGLFDEIRLCIAPIILGNGRHLFTNGNIPKNLKLLEAKPLANGGVIVRYEVINK